MRTFRYMRTNIYFCHNYVFNHLRSNDVYVDIGECVRSSQIDVDSTTWRYVLAGSLKLDIAPVADEVRYCLTPELYRVDPYPDDSGRPIKEIVEFPPREIFVPHNIYRSRTFYNFD